VQWSFRLKPWMFRERPPILAVYQFALLLQAVLVELREWFNGVL
jgi:hypothetical protein